MLRSSEGPRTGVQRLICAIKNEIWNNVQATATPTVTLYQIPEAMNLKYEIKRLSLNPKILEM